MPTYSASLRYRMFLAFAGLYVLLLFGTGLTTYLAVERHLVFHSRERLANALNEIERLLAENPAEIEELERHRIVPSFIIVENGAVRFESRRWKKDKLHIRPVDAGGERQWTTRTADGGYARVGVRQRVWEGGRRTIAAAVDDEEVAASLGTLRRTLLVVGPLALLVGLIAGVVAARTAVRPLGRVIRAMEEIREPATATRLEPKRLPGELRGLARSYNQMLDRLSRSFERLRTFASDASHELRTPLMAMRAEGEIALRSERGAEYYKEVIGSMLEEVDRMTHLAESLLELTRCEAGCDDDEPGAVHPHRVCTEIVDQLHVLAEEKSQTVDVVGPPGLAIVSRDEPLRLVLRNLVHNAIVHCPEHTTIRVRVSAGTASTTIEVEDDGPGVPLEKRDEIFERFVRADASRTHGEGTGLGLAIARRAAACIGARLTLAQSASGGCLFRLEIPTGATTPSR